MNVHKSLIVALCFLNFTISQAQNYAIKGQIKGLKSERLILAHYFGATQYFTKDTAQTDSVGRFVFDGTKPLSEGLYLVINAKGKQLFELIIDKNQTFGFETDSVNYFSNMKISGSKENEVYYQYQKKLRTSADEIKMLQLQQRLRTDMLANNKVANIRNELSSYYKQFVKDNKSTLATKIYEAGTDIELPKPPSLKDGKPDSTWLFNYYRSHYWDKIDFADERLVRTPHLQRKLDNYFGNLVYQNPDSLTKAADFVIDKARAGKAKDMISYCIWYLTNKYENPKIVGTEAVFVHLAEKYYLGGIMPITDSLTIKSIAQKVKIMKPLLVGKTMPALNMSDTLQINRTLADVKANYTVVVFYDPECVHCRQSTPALKAFYDKNKSRGIQIYAAAIAHSPEQWRKYINEFGVQDWIHVYDYSFRIDFKNEFDVVTTPQIYVLDKDKKIVGRRLPAEQLEAFIDFEERKVK
jgi:thiol-disulfide isomerase/thioredoxin